MSHSDKTDPTVTTALIAEYNSLRSEVLARFQTQNQAFNFLLVILGASITAIITTANGGKPEHLQPVILSVTLLLPLITCPLSYIFFDNELMIHAIGSYIYYDRRKRLEECTGYPHFFGSLTEFRFLPPTTRNIFHSLSRGRWVLFCLPAFMPVVFVPLYLYMTWDFLQPYSGIVVASAVIIFLLDLSASYLLATAIKWLLENDRYQGRLVEAQKQSDTGKEA